MLVENKLKILKQLTDTSTNEELIWINGYFNGIVSSLTNTGAAAKNGVNKITIAYGTETGNAKKLATEFAAKAKKQGIHAKVQSLDQYKLHELTKEEYFVAVISTHGDGEPPAAAKKFYDHVHNNGFKLDKLKYSVLALGDTSYPLFCKAGEDVDEQLSKLGGKRIIPIQKCDIDYRNEADTWFNEVCKALNNHHQPSADSFVSKKKTTGKKKYTGNIITHINLNDRGSNKETYHIEIQAEDVAYLPGDSLGIIPENNRSVVEEIINITHVDATINISYKDELISLFNLLQKKLNIIFLPERVIKHYATVVEKDIPFIRTDLIVLLKQYPVKDADQFIEIVKILEPIVPRLYSIASSPEEHGGEIHITVAKNFFTLNNKKKTGLASEFLCDYKVNDTLNFYIHPNNRFRLPDSVSNILMIGPGTGIAPFRSFIAEREATGAQGKNWLFFGEQHFTTDFLYQSEIQNWFETGTLTKVSTAFSRDQKEKIYVQHKMMQHGKEFFEWLETGAYVYVCGTKNPMSIDVEKSILNIIETFGERSKDEATQYLDSMKEDGRYLTDVY